jgi:hypothetical protein
VVGSITHCAGYRAAAVAPAGQVSGLGIDAEPSRALPPRLLARILRAEEMLALVELRHERPTVCWDRLLFSAKEATYKARLSRSCGGVGMTCGAAMGFTQMTIEASTARPGSAFDIVVLMGQLRGQDGAGDPKEGPVMVTSCLGQTALCAHARAGSANYIPRNLRATVERISLLS